jgi:PPM family protein phosphatase
MRHRGRFRHDAAVIGCYGAIMDSPPLIEVNAFTHEGRRRANNEDSITVGGWVSDVAMSGPRRSRHELTAPFLVAVADGMGGHAAGEVASRYAIKRLAAESLAGGERDVAATLIAINAELYDTMAAAPSFRGMGTTAAGLLLTPSQAIWFNLGDSRIYCRRAGQLEQLSIDDVPPGERSGIITQCLGGGLTFTRISPHIGAEDLSIPSCWLLCSDGLTDMLPEEIIGSMMEGDDEEAVRDLFTLAMEAGGDDNISIIVVSVMPANSSTTASAGP